MKCFNCNNDINTEASVCSFCGTQINQVKSRFIAYIGAPNNLNGYQKSYKLVLLINIIRNFNEKKEALVSKVISDVREFYLDRYNRGLLPDIDVDSRIANIHESKDYDVFAVMKSQPYNVINQKGFLFINRNENDELIFVFHDDITASMSDSEFSKLDNLLNEKLTFYYQKYNLDEVKIDEESYIEDSSEDTCEPDGVFENGNYDSVEITNISTLGQRAKNVLMRNGIFTIGELKAFVQGNDLNDLKNLGQKTHSEIYALLQSDMLAFSEPNSEVAVKKELTISRAFAENTYNLFVQYCKANGLTLFSELIGFDFDSLVYESGFGPGRIEKLKAKYKEILENIDEFNVEKATYTIKSNVSISLHDSNKNLPISILKNLDVSEKLVVEIHGLNVNTMGELEEVISSDTSKIELLKRIGKKKLDVLVDALKSLEVPLNAIAQGLLEKIRTDRSFEVYVKRAEGFTLQEIADMYDLTRERVRQIEKKFNNKIKPLMLTLITNYFSEKNQNYIRMQTVLDIFDDDNFDKVIIHTLNGCDELEYLDFAELYIAKTSKEQNTFEKLYEIAVEFVGDGINLYDKLDELDDMLAGKGYSYIDADAFLNLLIACNAKFYGDYVVFDRQSYGYLCSKVVGKYFKDGINLYSEDDLNLLREYVKKEFGALKLPENNRALASRIDSFLVIVDKGKSNVIENISVDLDALEEVKKYIDSEKRSELYYSEIFSEYEGLLCMTTGITNPYCLHGVLSYFYPDNYTYGRDFLTKSGDEYVSISIEERIDELLRTSGHALSRKEIKNKLAGYSDVMIFNAVYRSEYLIQWDSNYYNTMHNITFENDEQEELAIILEMIIRDNDGYCSDRWIYEEVISQMPDFCSRNNIENHTNLFYILGALLSTKYKFSQPHIAKYDLFDDLTTKNVAIHFLNDVNHVSYSEFTDIAEKMHWSPVTVGLVFSELETEYIRISQDEYVKKDIVSYDSQVIDSIKQTIGSKLNGIGYLSLIGFDDFEDFIDVGYEWNTFLLASIVENCEMGFKIVQPQTRDRRYQKGIIIEANSSTDTYDGIVAATMKYHGIESLRENQFLSFLVLNHLTTKATPRELQLSDVIKYENETYSV